MLPALGFRWGRPQLLQLLAGMRAVVTCAGPCCCCCCCCCCCRWVLLQAEAMIKHYKTAILLIEFEGDRAFALHVSGEPSPPSCVGS